MRHNNRGETEMATQWERSADIVWEEFQSEAVLVSVKCQKTWVLNRYASLIWKCCDGSISVDILASRLAKACGRELNAVRRDILKFCAELEQKGLLTASSKRTAAVLPEIPALCFAGISLPKIVMESQSIGFRNRPSARGAKSPG